MGWAFGCLPYGGDKNQNFKFKIVVWTVAGNKNDLKDEGGMNDESVQPGWLLLATKYWQDILRYIHGKGHESTIVKERVANIV